MAMKMPSIPYSFNHTIRGLSGDFQRAWIRDRLPMVAVYKACSQEAINGMFVPVPMILGACEGLWQVLIQSTSRVKCKQLHAKADRKQGVWLAIKLLQ
jgi:hypothetical protein